MSTTVQDVLKDTDLHHHASNALWSTLKKAVVPGWIGGAPGSGIKPGAPGTPPIPAAAGNGVGEGVALAEGQQAPGSSASTGIETSGPQQPVMHAAKPAQADVQPAA